MIKDTIPGVVGNCSVVTSFSIAWLTDNAVPVLHVISVIVGIIASIATAMYYLLEWRAVRKRRASKRIKCRPRRK